MKKLFLFLGAMLILSFSARAQRIDSSTNAIVKPVKQSEAIEKKQEVTQPAVQQQKTEEVEIQEDLPPTTVTPEQKAEINIYSKRQTRGTVRTQSPRQRRSFIDALQMLDKKASRQKAIAEGKSDREIEKAAESVEKPKVNPLNDASMEKYLYEKVDVNERTKNADE